MGAGRTPSGILRELGGIEGKRTLIFSRDRGVLYIKLRFRGGPKGIRTLTEQLAKLTCCRLTPQAQNCRVALFSRAAVHSRFSFISTRKISSVLVLEMTATFSVG
jgi:hypothetical protein